MKENYRYGLMGMKFLFALHVKSFILFFIFCITINAKVCAMDPANPNASSDAKLILNFFASLTNQADHHLISGQFIGYSGGTNNYGMITTFIIIQANGWESSVLIMWIGQTVSK